MKGTTYNIKRYWLAKLMTKQTITAVSFASTLLITPVHANAPLELATKLPPASVNLLKINKSKVDKEVKSSTRYQRGSTKVNKQTASIRLTLPDGSVVTAHKKKAYLTNSGAIVWQGKIASNKASSLPGDNNITLVSSGDHITATIKVDGRLFKIAPVDQQSFTLEEIDQKLLPDEHSGKLDDPSANFSVQSRTISPLATAQASATTSTIRMLVGYTTEALNQNPGMQALIELAIAETNQGFTDSGVNAQVELAHSYELNYAESGDHGTDLDRFHEPNDGYMDDVYALRDLHAADVATILIGDASACGRAREIGASEATAFMVVKDSCATGYYSFGHELGHLMSARHNPEKDNNTTPYAFGHGFLYTSGGWRSIMSYNSNSCCTRQNFWSDPRKTFQSVTRGTTQTHDNARVLNLTAATVAAFRSGGSSGNTPPVADFTASINDLTVSLTNNSYDAENNISAYSWDFGDGNQSSVISPDHSYAASGIYMVSLTTTDDAGASNVTSQQVTVSDSVSNQLPTSNFSYNNQGLSIDFIDQSSDSDGTITTWLWDFGDGGQSNLQAPKHIYATAGSYSVELTVTDDQGAADSLRLTVEVNQESIISSVDFESDLGAWQQSSNDDWDWTRQSGSTGSSSTGPDAGSGGQGYYLYMETSNNKGAYTNGEQVILESEVLNLASARLTFDYHMYGSDIGSLSVDVLSNGSWTNDVWTISGQQHSSSSADFTQANVDLSIYSGAIQLRFRAVAAGNYKGDTAIDNITILGVTTAPENQAPEFSQSVITLGDAGVDNSYSASIATFASDADNDNWSFSLISGPSWLSLTSDGILSGIPSTSGLGLNTFNVRVTDSRGASADAQVDITVIEADSEQELSSLNFENDIDNGWTNRSDASHVWESEAGTTPSSNTGPSEGAITTGKYGYVETSKDYAYNAGDTAYLDSPIISGSGRSLSFYAHMYGTEIGSLSVDVFHQGSWQLDLLLLEGQQHASSSDAFTLYNIELTQFSDDIIIRFRAEAVGGWKGDIAIDDIVITGKP